MNTPVCTCAKRSGVKFTGIFPTHCLDCGLPLPTPQNTEKGCCEKCVGFGDKRIAGTLPSCANVMDCPCHSTTDEMDEFDRRFVRDDGLMDKYTDDDEFMADAIKAFIKANFVSRKDVGEKIDGLKFDVPMGEEYIYNQAYDDAKKILLGTLLSPKEK